MQQRHAKHLRQNRGEGTAAVPIETFLELKGSRAHLLSFRWRVFSVNIWSYSCYGNASRIRIP